MTHRYENVVLGRHTDGPYRWFAHFDNYDGPGDPVGHGKTPGEAVNDLFDIAELDT
jgi:hypothetical protein